MSLRQFILPISKFSILVPLHRLRIMALLSSGCKATVEGLSNVQSSSTTKQWQSHLAGWQLHVLCWQSSKHFHFWSIKFILLFHVMPDSHCSLYSILECNFLIFFFTYCWLPTCTIGTMKHYSCHLLMHILEIHYSVHLIMGQNISIYCEYFHILVQKGLTPATF